MHAICLRACVVVYLLGVSASASVCVCVCVCAAYFFKHDVCLLTLCVRACICVFIIQGHSIAPHGSIPYPGRHGYGGHLSQRVQADQTGVHPDYFSPRRLLLGTFVAHNAQVLVATGENQQERRNIVLMSQSDLMCVFVSAFLHLMSL